MVERGDGRKGWWIGGCRLRFRLVLWLFWVQFEGVVWWSFRAMDEGFRSVVNGSKGSIEISESLLQNCVVL